MMEVMKIMATSFKRSHVHIATLERQPSSTGVVAAGCWSDFEEISHVQGKEQRLHFAGAVIKRYPTSKVRETQIRW